MSIENWLDEVVQKLQKAGIATARLDCLVLLEDVTGKDRSYLLAHVEYELTSEQVSELTSQIKRRIKHEPLAYIRGKSEFYGREFIVNKHTLQPRPETETMIDLLKQILHSQKPSLLKDSPLTERDNVDWWIVDVGTGSGCIGITAKLEVPGVEVIATDVSKECLRVARQNAKNLGADVELYHGDLFKPTPNSSFYLPVSTFALLANLPYVPDSHTVNQAAMQEPKLAIFGGSDGLDLYRKMFAQISEFANKPRFIFTESLPFQHQKLAKIASKAGYELNGSEDFIQVFSLLE